MGSAQETGNDPSAVDVREREEAQDFQTLFGGPLGDAVQSRGTIYLRRENNSSFGDLLKKNRINPLDTQGTMPGAGDSEMSRTEYLSPSASLRNRHVVI